LRQEIVNSSKAIPGFRAALEAEAERLHKAWVDSQ